MDTPLTLIQLTDLHILAKPDDILYGVKTEQSFHKTLEYVFKNHLNIDLILITGDLAQTPCHSSYQRIIDTLEKYNTRTICLPGNHDDYSIMHQLINSKLINCNKQLAFKYWQIICLNSQQLGEKGGLLDSNQLELLNDFLQNNASLNTLIALHHPPLPINSPWMDKMILENRDEFFSVLENYPQVKVIICGHIHQQLEKHQENILILGTPSTCFQFQPFCTEYTLDNKAPGYRELKLFPDGTIITKVHRFRTTEELT